MCGVTKGRKQYSFNQWQKPGRRSKCKPCIAVLTDSVVNSSQANDTPRSSLHGSNVQGNVAVQHQLAPVPPVAPVARPVVAAPAAAVVTLVALSDTHNQHRRINVPPGDILVHLGDAADRGNRQHLEDFAAWFSQQPHRHKLIIYGNHDPVANSVAKRILEGVPRCTLLVDAAVEVMGIRIFGSSYKAPLEGDFSSWPTGGTVDVLLTHSPPGAVRGQGSGELLRQAMASGARLHLFGHNHYSRGVEAHGPCTFINCSNVGNTSANFESWPVAPAVVVNYNPTSNAKETVEAVLRVECPDPVGATRKQLETFYGRADGTQWPALSREQFEEALRAA